MAFKFSSRGVKYSLVKLIYSKSFSVFSAAGLPLAKFVQRKSNYVVCRFEPIMGASNPEDFVDLYLPPLTRDLNATLVFHVHFSARFIAWRIYDDANPPSFGNLFEEAALATQSRPGRAVDTTARTGTRDRHRATDS
jgi:hypothetical protein